MTPDMHSPGLDAVLESVVDDEGVGRLVSPSSWLQGQTLFGGMSAALAYSWARCLTSDLPLRAIQLAYVGPAEGELTVSAALIRRGRSTAFVRADVAGAQGTALTALVIAGLARASDL